MKRFRFLIILLIISMLQPCSFAAFWHKEPATQLGNDIQKEEYPESKDVEPKVEDTLVIKGGVEETMDISMEECLRYALGNNPKIQAAMQDVFASDARIRQAWSAYFPQFSWQTGYTRIKQLQLSDALGANLIFNYYVLDIVPVS